MVQQALVQTDVGVRREAEVSEPESHGGENRLQALPLMAGGLGGVGVWLFNRESTDSDICFSFICEGLNDRKHALFSFNFQFMQYQ